MNKRGRKSKTLGSDRIIDIVFLMRYGLKAGTAFSTHPAGPLTFHVRGAGFPNSLGELARRPGTVNGYRWVKGRAIMEKPEGNISVKKACEEAEKQFSLRIPRRVKSTRLEADGSFTDTESQSPPLIAKRESEGNSPPGAARQWLVRALRKEAARYARLGFDANPRDSAKWKAMETEHQRAEWREQAERATARRKKKR